MRNGCSHLDGQGVLVEGFEYRPAMGIPYNYPYYGDLMEDAGLEKKLYFISWFADSRFRLPDRILEVAEKVKARRGLVSVTFGSKDELRRLVPQIVNIYDQSFTEVYGYVPLTDLEGQAISERLLRIADPSLISVLMKRDEVAGFVLAYPDLSAALRRSRGRIWPTGWWHLAREFEQTRWINFNGAAILDRYRGLAGNALLYAEMYRIPADHPQYQYADLVQSQEANTRMGQDLSRMGMIPRKRHHLYQKSLA